MKENECFEYETERIATTDGQKEKVRVCYCGTTACMKLPPITSYPLPNDFKRIKEIECEEIDEKTERAFYNKVMGSKFF